VESTFDQDLGARNPKSKLQGARSRTSVSNKQANGCIKPIPHGSLDCPTNSKYFLLQQKQGGSGLQLQLTNFPLKRANPSPPKHRLLHPEENQRHHNNLSGESDREYYLWSHTSNALQAQDHARGWLIPPNSACTVHITRQDMHPQVCLPLNELPVMKHVLKSL
jgi:hypothetical protein